MSEQFALYDVEAAPRKTNNLRRRWEDGFQRWSNKKAEEETTAEGVCGYGAICDFCTRNDWGRPCVRALNAMCRDNHITIDYEKTSYEEAWEGEFGNG